MSYYIPILADRTAFGDKERKSIVIGYELVIEHPQPPDNGRPITTPHPVGESKK